MIILTSVVVVIINIAICTFFDKIVFIEKRHTVNDETMGQFKKITVMQFINIGIVILLVNFNTLNEPFLGFIPILQGEYGDFSSYWYGQVGSTLCLTLMINIFSPHASKIMIPLLKLVFRCKDRSWKNVFNIEGKEDGVNTKKVFQSELNTLYTGDQISSHYVYAQNYSYLWCVLMYSGGLPILYPFACIFFFVLYWVYKGLLLKYYEKTTRFNEQLPLFATHWIKLGIIIHGFITLTMITNSHLLPTAEIWEAMSEQQVLENGTSGERFVNRFLSKGYAIVYIIFYLCVIIWFLFEAILLDYIWKLFGLCCKKKVDNEDEFEKEDEWSNDFFNEVEIEFLKGYEDKA